LTPEVKTILDYKKKHPSMGPAQITLVFVGKTRASASGSRSSSGVASWTQCTAPCVPSATPGTAPAGPAPLNFSNLCARIQTLIQSQINLRTIRYITTSSQIETILQIPMTS
jgi:hypothetical protein